MCSIEKAGVVVLERPIALVQRERRMHEPKKINASHAVNFFKTSAVEVPNSDSLASPPKEDPRPELLLSCMRMTIHNKTHRIMNNTIVKKYKNVISCYPEIKI